WAQIEAREPAGLVLGPGPGRPEAATTTMECLRLAPPSLPILGVCLGHQAIGEHFGGRVVRSEPVHGHEAAVHHDGRGLFAGLPQPMSVGRYHSLILERESLPECLEASARTADGLIMGLRHRELPIESVQFHPESILSRDGHALLGNFLARCGRHEGSLATPSGGER
ncbi:MAG: aminodeoxychorismate/anthranilate synthase component II, partial [Planctomycetes bacterium]|nr:aminodeoxychorismate/anthranilate synthase component II [Planctomycetota bacterium]